MIINFKDLAGLRTGLRDKTIVFSGGTYDLLHPGHINYLEKLKSMGDVVVVAISPDKSVKRRKGEGRPILNESERLSLVNSIKYVDYALIAPDYTEGGTGGTVQCLLELKPDIFVSIDPKWIEFVKSRKDIPEGTEVRIIPRGENFSTSEIIDRIYKGKERV